MCERVRVRVRVRVRSSLSALSEPVILLFFGFAAVRAKVLVLT